jgi:phage tail tape-measure protein
MTDPTTDRAVRRPASRYGRLARRPGRWAVIALAVVAVAAGIAVAVIGYQRLGAADVTGELAGYRVIDDQTVSVAITVTRSDPSRPVVCIARVRSKDGSETGRREVLVGPSPTSTVQVTTIVKSSQPPVMGDVYGCGTGVPAYLRSI